MTEQTSEDKATPQLPFDPLAFWKQLQDIQLQGWAKIMSETVGSEEFAQTMGQSVNSYLETAAPIQQQVEQAMAHYLRQMNMPTHQEVISLAERLTQLELRVDDLDAKLDEVLDRLKAIQTMLK
jgi:polyhydroxyalkanoic acid synthase PhaR subunit